MCRLLGVNRDAVSRLTHIAGDHSKALMLFAEFCKMSVSRAHVLKPNHYTLECENQDVTFLSFSIQQIPDVSLSRAQNALPNIVANFTSEANDLNQSLWNSSIRDLAQFVTARSMPLISQRHTSGLDQGSNTRIV